MNLLIVTQKADRDDPILGFFHGWIGAFSKHFDKVIVICLHEGRHDLPPNVEVHSLGKESGSSKPAQMVRFYSMVWRLRKSYDRVFVHMNPIYMVLAGPLWKLWGKKTAMWYTHKSVDLKLRIAEAFADVIFTASPEGFRLPSNKVIAVGHGIDTARFSSAIRTKAIGAEPISIISVGRLTPIKDPETLIEAAKILKERWDKEFKAAFIGSPAKESDTAYADEMKKLVSRYGLDGTVSFIGDVPPEEMPDRYAAADLSVNLAPTGGLDKAVIESMAAGTPVLVCNEAFKPYLGDLAKDLMFSWHDQADLARKIMALSGPDRIMAIGSELQKTALERFDADKLIAKISDKLISWKNR